MTTETELFEEISNPLDSVEDVLSSHEWVFRRTTDDELTVDVTGRYGTYRMLFFWQDEFSALQFVCQYDFVIAENNIEQIPVTLMSINSELWLGHFDLDLQTRAPVFRYNSLFRGMTQTSGADHIEDIVDIALSECERFYPVFQLLAGTEELDGADLRLALMTSAGES